MDRAARMPSAIGPPNNGRRIFTQGFVLLLQGFVLHEVPDQTNDRTRKHQEVLADGLVADGVGLMRFADTGRMEELEIFGFTGSPGAAGNGAIVLKLA
jgi:hypothetical protein